MEPGARSKQLVEELKKTINKSKGNLKEPFVGRKQIEERPQVILGFQDDSSMKGGSEKNSYHSRRAEENNLPKQKKEGKRSISPAKRIGQSKKQELMIGEEPKAHQEIKAMSRI